MLIISPVYIIIIMKTRYNKQIYFKWTLSDNWHWFVCFLWKQFV